MDEMTLTLNNPLTEEEWDLIEDVDFDKTNSITFHTKHGKTVKFVKCTDERTEDLISRAAALDGLSKLRMIDTYEIDGDPCLKVKAIDVDEMLKQLPSAQTSVQLERTKERTETHGVCLDAISRQEAIEYFVTNVGFHDEDGYPIDDSDELRKIWTEYFDGIPSAQSEIIHCRDCKHWERNYYQDVETCFEHRNVDGTQQATPPEYYCGSAERREENG